MRALILLGALVAHAAVFGAPQAVAHYPCGEGPVFGSAAGTGVVYVALDTWGLDHSMEWTELWVYVETNGVPGLQRGGVALTGEPEWCTTTSGEPDTAVTCGTLACPQY